MERIRGLKVHNFLFSWMIYKDSMEVKRLEKFVTSVLPRQQVLLKITVYANNGGYISTMKRIIAAVEDADKKKIAIEISFSGFVISAAAYLFAWFSYYSTDYNNVKVTAGSNLCVIYHKPRLTDENTGEILLFASDIDRSRTLSPEEKLIIQLTDNFDEVFSVMCEIAERMGKPLAAEAIAAYNLNYDAVITYLRGDPTLGK